MSGAHMMSALKALERRLLSDIKEMQQDPYPNVHLRFDDSNVRKACLILTPEDEEPLHLTINFWKEYPLSAPEITIQTSIKHPNVFGSYICATMLNTDEGWTPAYTLRSIVIQLLSFFCSDSLEQDHGGGAINLAAYKRETTRARYDTFQNPGVQDRYSCRECGFGTGWSPSQTEEMDIDRLVATLAGPMSANHIKRKEKQSKLFTMPDEVILQIFGELKTHDVLSFADAIPTIKTMMNSYDFIRIRELQCFCLKQSFMNTKLGIGVTVVGGRRPVFGSEFDLLSQGGFLPTWDPEEHPGRGF